MKYPVTAAIESLVRGLRSISDEIEPKLHLVSRDARSEWEALQSSWPSDDDLREGLTVLTEDELKTSESKVRRFSDIIHGCGPHVAEERTTRSTDNDSKAL